MNNTYADILHSFEHDNDSTPLLNINITPAYDAAKCERTQYQEYIIGLIVPTIYVFVIMIGVIGNCLVVAVVLMNKHMLTSTNVLIMGLALSDLLFLVACVPFTALDYSTSSFPFPEWWCNVQNYLQHLTAYVTVWTLVLMAGDRFLAVVFPIKSLTLRSSKNAFICLFTLWAIAGIACTFIAIDYHVYTYFFCGESRSFCGLSYMMNRDESIRIKLYYFSFNAFGYIVPLTVSCVLYAKMLHRFWLTGKSAVARQTQNRTENASDSQTTRSFPLTFKRFKAPVFNRRQPHAISEYRRKCPVDRLNVPRLSLGGTTNQYTAHSDNRLKKQLKAKKRVTRMILTVITTFAGCWLPFNICFFVHGYYNGNLPYDWQMPFLVIQIVSQVLAYTNSCLNPILYAFLSDNYRHGFLIIVTRCASFVTMRRRRHDDVQRLQFDVTTINQQKPSMINRIELRQKLAKSSAPTISRPLLMNEMACTKIGVQQNGKCTSLKSRNYNDSSQVDIFVEAHETPMMLISND